MLEAQGKEAINGKYTELCTQRGVLTHQIDRLTKQLSMIDSQIDGLDVALSVVTQLEAQPNDKEKIPTDTASDSL